MNVQEKSNEGNLDVVSKVSVVWKRIPGFSKYEASDKGIIRYSNEITDERWLLKQYETATSKGSYKRVAVNSDDRSEDRKEVHQLVCLAFKGLPPVDGQKYEVNHIDGDKHNNHPENLEWVTRSENLNHAYRTGLRTDNVPVIVTDHVSTEIVKYYSMGEVSRQFGIAHKDIVRIIDNHREKKYMDRFTFQRDFSNVKATNHNFVKEIMAFDYENGKRILADNSAMMSYVTGVKRGTILHAIRNNSERLIAGFVFKYLDLNYIFPPYSKDEISISKYEYFNKKPVKEKQYGVKYKDYCTGKITECDTMLSAAEKSGVVRGTIAYLLSVDAGRLFKGKMFKYHDDKREFPDFSQEMIDLSLRIKKPEFPPVKVTDIEFGTTKLYASMSEFASDNGFNNVAVANHVRIYPNNPFKKRYKIEKT